MRRRASEATNEALSQSAKDSEHSVDEAHTGSSEAKDRESRAETAAAESERAHADAPPSNGAAASIEHAATDDESAVSVGTDEALEIDAAARGVASDLPDAAEAAEVDAAVRGEAQPTPDAPEQAQIGEAEQLATEPVAIEEQLSAAASSEPARAIDFDAAERFAASIRPSWADAPPISQPPANAIGAVDGAAHVIRHTAQTDVTAPLRKRRGSAYAILGASLVGVAGLLYLGILSSTVDHTSRRGLSAKDAEGRPHLLKPAPLPVETHTEPAQAPEPAQIAQQQQPPAAQPSDPNAGSRAPAEQATAVEPSADRPDTPELMEPRFAGETTEVAEGQPAAAVAAEPSPANEPTAPQVAAATQPPPPAAQPPAEPAPPAAQPPPAAAALAAAPNPPSKAQDRSSQPSAAPAPPALKALPGAPADRTKVLLSLAAYPPNTRLRVDGLIVVNPYRARVPKSSKHRIDAAAPGYASETHLMRIEADVQLMLSLKRDQAQDVKADPYAAQQRRSTTAAAAVASPSNPNRDRGAGFVAENPY